MQTRPTLAQILVSICNLSSEDLQVSTSILKTQDGYPTYADIKNHLPHHMVAVIDSLVSYYNATKQDVGGDADAIATKIIDELPKDNSLLSCDITAKIIILQDLFDQVDAPDIQAALMCFYNCIGTKRREMGDYAEVDVDAEEQANINLGKELDAAKKVLTLRSACFIHKQKLKQSILRDLQQQFPELYTIVNKKIKIGDKFIPGIAVLACIMHLTTMSEDEIITLKQSHPSPIMQYALTCQHRERLLELPKHLQLGLLKYHANMELRQVLTNPNLKPSEKLTNFKAKYNGTPTQPQSMRKLLERSRNTFDTMFSRVVASVLLGMTGIGLVAIPFILFRPPTKSRRFTATVDHILAVRA